MLRFSIQFIALSLLAITFTLTVGCGPTQPPPVASRPAPKGVGGGEEGEDSLRRLLMTPSKLILVVLESFQSARKQHANVKI
ncbi:MAG: hypothetical protein ABL888_17190 [Pirellulaceae bacterium]